MGALLLVGAIAITLPGSGASRAEPSSAPELTPAPAWRTDLTRRDEGVTLNEFIQALAQRDLIPALNDPHMTAVAAVGFLRDDEPVIAVELSGEWRAYPMQIMVWHEIANDSLGGTPIAVTFCPLCHTSVVFDRRLGGQLLDFGVSGLLRRSDLVMYDRQSESWWQQATGRGLVGAHAGDQLEILFSQVVGWGAFRDAHPDGTVLDLQTGWDRPYGRSPYPGWDRLERNPFLGAAQLEPCDGAPGCLDAKERVGVVRVADAVTVFPFRFVAAAGGLAQTDVAGTPVVVRWLPEVATVLDNEILERADQVGTLVAFGRRVGGRVLRFELRGSDMLDTETGSRWDEFGLATDGPLVGTRLPRIVTDTPYWFGYAAFASQTSIWEKPGD